MDAIQNIVVRLRILCFNVAIGLSCSMSLTVDHVFNVINDDCAVQFAVHKLNVIPVDVDL